MSDDQIGLFATENAPSSPLAYRIRPKSLDYFMGQDSLKQKLASLNWLQLPHLIFYGPPGCGKTTIASILAQKAKAMLYEFNAVLGGVADLRKIIQQAKSDQELLGSTPIIFIDEIHRFNKAQQDALLPYLERGDFVLFGATTENPNTSLNQAILSRVQKWRLSQLSESEVEKILTHACEELDIELSKSILQKIASFSNGDARAALNQLEVLAHNKSKLTTMSEDKILKELLFDQRRYDKNSDRHYDVISAFIKSVRGSDVDAAVLWLAVMLDGGEDIEFIARRLIILASEDVGNADPRALQMATSAHYAIKSIGMPEARIILAQATTYLAQAPKSNASYLAINKALEHVRDNPTIEVPTHLRNHHPDKKNYKYPHSYAGHWTPQDYHPDQTQFFESSELGYEKLQQDYLRKLKKN
ncbi:MAG: hypothetical protein CME62_09620 [Halobacteriovoraceae bacterium]|nr:hypothetical protein [Halobacteriovoraceae bacterium]|tara:strand:+ start:4529 stop:5776 length:1248 start_codon:yes stop_codon:yes gene_type:complete